MQHTPRSQHAPLAQERARTAHQAWPPTHPPVPSAAMLWRRERRAEPWGRVSPAAR